MSLDFLFAPVEYLDETVSHLFEGAPLPVALLLAALLGLRHATDPDHLMAVTSLVAADGAGTRAATRLGALWGVGHAATLLVIGLPLILLGATVPEWLGTGAETLVGIVIAALAARVLLRWWRRDRPHAHEPHRLRTPAPGARDRRAARAGRDGRRRAAADRGDPGPARRLRRAGRVRPAVGRLDGGLHVRLRVDADAPAVQRFSDTFLLPLLGAGGLLFGGVYAGLI